MGWGYRIGRTKKWALWLRWPPTLFFRKHIGWEERTVTGAAIEGPAALVGLDYLGIGTTHAQPGVVRTSVPVTRYYQCVVGCIEVRYRPGRKP